MNLVLRPARLLLFLVALISSVRAADDFGPLAGTVTVPDGLKVSDVQQAIITGVSARGWALKDKASGKLVLFLEQSGWRSKMTLTYDTKEVKIYSTDSGKPDKSGVIKKQAIPESWVKYMKQDITRNLGLKAFDK